MILRTAIYNFIYYTFRYKLYSEKFVLYYNCLNNIVFHSSVLLYSKVVMYRNIGFDSATPGRSSFGSCKVYVEEN